MTSLRTDRGLLIKISAALCTRFDSLTPSEARRLIPDQAEEWGKLRIRNDGDTMRASKMSATDTVEDSRDASFVRVSHSLLSFRGIP